MLDAVSTIGTAPTLRAASVMNGSVRTRQDVCMKRTTIEIDEELLARAKRALRQDTTRVTVEEALRQAADRAESEHAERATRQCRYLESLSSRADLTLLASKQMWR